MSHATRPFFLFATGIENSSPTIHGGRTRVDEMERCRHYDLYELDFDLVQELGVHVLRYGVPLHHVWRGSSEYDWAFSDAAFHSLQRRDMVVIADLCHFGLPDWLADFQNPDFPDAFAGYASDFARRYPWIQLYTPVNEMFVCAKFSASHGWWNEQQRSDRAFVTALKHIVRANVLAMRAILKVRPDAIFIQSESSEYFHPENPGAIDAAEVLNARRFLTLDLNYGRRVESDMYEFLMDHGMTREEYHFFCDPRLKQHCVLGNDYYVANEHRVAADGSTRPAGEVFGYDEITGQYYDRYRLPVMHTETNYEQGPRGDEAVYWLWKEWSNVLCLRNGGIPIVGFTWYSLTDQVDWDTALREDNGNVNALGLYDLDRNIRPVGEAYRTLIRSWCEVLPTQSVCLQLPLALPSDHTPAAAARLRRRQRAQPEEAPPATSPANPD